MPDNLHQYTGVCVMPLVPVVFNIAHVLFVCRQLAPETGTGYWYQKTGQCVWPFRVVGGGHDLVVMVLGSVSTGMGGCLRVRVAFTPSWYLINQPGQLSLAIPSWLSTVNTDDGDGHCKGRIGEFCVTRSSSLSPLSSCLTRSFFHSELKTKVGMSSYTPDLDLCET